MSAISQVERKGAMRGGYIDKRRSKILSWRNFKVAIDELKVAEAANKESDEKLRNAENVLSTAGNKFAKSKVDASKLISALRLAPSNSSCVHVISHRSPLYPSDAL